MEVLEWHSGDDALGPLFEFEDFSPNSINMLFGIRGVHNNILHKIINSLVELHVHEDGFYHHAMSEIYFHNPFKY